MRKLANILFLLVLLAQSAFAANFFNIFSSGTAAEINIILCLNAKGPLTCQTYDVHALDLIISTTVPNHTYPFAGIKINTPGYQPTNCTPLDNGYCMFAASNTAGTAINIQSANNMPPSTPTNIMVTPGDNQVTVSWTASSGTQPIRYTVSASPFAVPPPECVNTLNTFCVFTNLTNGVSYTFSVTAANAAGQSPESTPSSPVTPASPPGPPTSVIAVGGPSRAELSWTPPVSDGGSPITGYSVTSSPEVTPPAECTNVDEPSCTFTGLTNGQAYTFTVVAINAIGAGSASTPSNSVTPENTVPAAPTNVIGIPGNTQVSLNWAAPDNGGSPITGYTVTSNPAVTTPAACTNVGTTSCVFNGLANGTSYTFTVEATNAVGTGSPSAASAPALPLPALYYSNVGWRYSAGGAVNFSTNPEPEGSTMAAIFADGLTLYEGNTNNNVFVSNNNGGLWTATSAQPTGSAVLGIFFNGNTLYAASNDAISYSTDGGASWAATASTGGSANKMFVSGTTLYVTSNNVIKYSTDNGTSWLSTSALPVGQAYGLFVEGDTIYAGSSQGAVYTSTDSGVTWIPTPTAPYAADVLVFDIAVSGNGIFVLPLSGSELAIKASFNGGLSWQTITQATNSINFALFVSANAIYAGTQAGNIAYSLNGGITWTTITQPDGTSVLSVLTSGTTLYATTSSGNVLISTNNGATWSMLTSPEAVAITSLFIGGTTLYTATQTGNVYISTTNGTSWTAVTQPDGGSSVNTIFIYNNDWYVGTQAGNILVSTNSGSTWTPTITAPEAGVPVNSVFVTSTTIYAGLENGNFRFSTNGGTSWTSGAAPGGGAIKSVTMKAGILYVGMASGEVKTSIDNGSTWQATNVNPDGNNQINSVYLSNFVL